MPAPLDPKKHVNAHQVNANVLNKKPLVSVRQVNVNALNKKLHVLAMIANVKPLQHANKTMLANAPNASVELENLVLTTACSL